jgi:hypothetical protein
VVSKRPPLLKRLVARVCRLLCTPLRVQSGLLKQETEVEQVMIGGGLAHPLNVSPPPPFRKRSGGRTRIAPGRHTLPLMPNGHDRLFVILTIVCATYRQRFDVWPTSAHLDPHVLHNLVLLFDADSFAELAQRIKLATHAEEQHAFFAAGEEGIVRSQDVTDFEELLTGGYLDEARAWLGVEPLDEEAL